MFPLFPPPEPPESTAEPARQAPRPRLRTSDPKQLPDHAPVDPLPKAWRTFLKTNVFHYHLLNKAERKRLRSDAWIFIGRKDWEGCGGLSVTDEMKVTIAAQACLMLLGQEHDYFGRVRSILLYPAGFRVQNERRQDEGWMPIGAGGQAIRHGPVILAWDRVLAEGRDLSAGDNLVIHEFAHQLDFVDGYADGTIDLPREQAEEWQEVLAAEYSWLRREVRRGRHTFLGDYAATNRSEFFATASERFFTRPAKLRHCHPKLYRMLKLIYGLNPMKWFAEA